LLDVEISIVNHQNRDLVRRCLASLPAACPGVSWHATVVDNRSDDGSLEMLAAEFPDVDVIANDVRRGYGANQNQVLHRVVTDDSARYCLVQNDDTELRADAVTMLVRTLDAEPGLGGVVPTIVIPPHDIEAPNRLAYPTPSAARWFDITRRTEPPDPDGYLQGCCLLLRTAALREVGLFDETFFLFYEDTDLSRRLVDAGWALGTCPGAVVEHVGHASVLGAEAAPLTPRRGLRSRYLYFRKHHGRLVAELVQMGERAAMLGRALRSGIRARRSGDGAARDRSRTLLALARYNPHADPPAGVTA
jgi:GT2 family glycosyltransferase